jgi:hypothetical protein
MSRGGVSVGPQPISDYWLGHVMGSPRTGLRALVRLLLVATMAVTAVLVPASAQAEDVSISGTVTMASGTVSQVNVSFYDDLERSAGSTSASGASWSAQVPSNVRRVSISGKLSWPGGATGQFNTNITVSSPASGTVVDLDVPMHPVTTSFVNQDGDPVPADGGVSCNGATADGRYWNTYSTTSAASTMTLWGIDVANPNPRQFVGCQLNVQRGQETAKTVWVNVGDSPVPEYSVILPDTVRLSGSLTVSPPNESQYIHTAYDAQGLPVASSDYLSQTGYAFTLVPGRYALAFDFIGDGMGGTQVQELRYASGVDITVDSTRDFRFDSRPLNLHFVDNDGAPVSTYSSFTCLRERDFSVRYGPDDAAGHPATDMTNTHQGSGTTSSLVVWLPVPDDVPGSWSCLVYYPVDDSGVWKEVPIPLPTGDDLTVVVPGGASYGGTPSDGPGDDGVPSVVEASGPNHGDGNGDGAPDSEQANVTSLPANGAAYAEGVPYVTVAGPVGTTLADVSTIDPTSLPNLPAGVTLPAGLASFKLTGLQPGATKAVSIFPGSMAGVNGYAKYKEGSGWSMLPSSQVHLFSDHLEVDLTDGGPEDADGVPDGTITDPGGVAKVVSGDTTPPTVTGQATTRPNAAGWYRGNVKVHWTATDPSGVAAAPADTVVTTEGANVTATSTQVCDKVSPTANCTTGTLTGLKIDKTAPSLAVTGVVNGATYTLGAVPTVGCSASDALSGLAGGCKGVKVGGNSAGVGGFGYAAAVGDKAGNSRAAAASWHVVYRFSGFAAPLNDPAVTPGAPTSIFKAGSTVPVAFSLKKATGQVATPASKPAWVSPVKGGKTTAPVNEAVNNSAGTSGSSFVWRNNRWEFNWSTKGLASGYLYRIGVRLDDGTTHYLTVGLR